MKDKNENKYELHNKNHYIQTREVEFEEDRYGSYVYKDYNDNKDNSNNDIIRFATNISVVYYAIRILYKNIRNG